METGVRVGPWRPKLTVGEAAVENDLHEISTHTDENGNTPTFTVLLRFDSLPRRALSIRVSSILCDTAGRRWCRHNGHMYRLVRVGDRTYHGTHVLCDTVSPTQWLAYKLAAPTQQFGYYALEPSMVEFIEANLTDLEVLYDHNEIPSRPVCHRRRVRTTRSALRV